jgi:hypothetical protein
VTHRQRELARGAVSHDVAERDRIERAPVEVALASSVAPIERLPRGRHRRDRRGTVALLLLDASALGRDLLADAALEVGILRRDAGELRRELDQLRQLTLAIDALGYREQVEQVAGASLMTVMRPRPAVIGLATVDRRAIARRSRPTAGTLPQPPRAAALPCVEAARRDHLLGLQHGAKIVDVDPHAAAPFVSRAGSTIAAPIESATRRIIASSSGIRCSWPGPTT